MNSYVYQLVDPRNMKPFYIGEGQNDRAWSHLKFKSGCNNPHKDRIIEKIQSSGLEVIVQILFENLTKEDAVSIEKEIIAKIGLENLSNISADANPPVKKGPDNGFYGKTHTDENKRKQGDVNRGKDIKTVEGKKSISNAMKERWKDPEKRERQIQALKDRKGEKRSKEAIESYKKAAAARNMKMTAEQRSARTLAGCKTKKEKYAGLKRQRYTDENGNMRFRYIPATPEKV